MTKIAILYLLMGLALVFVGPAAKGLRAENANLAPEVTKFARAALLSAISLAIILLWPVMVPSAWRNKVWQKHPKEENLFSLMDAYMSASGTDQDQLENGYGEFGRALTNPIPTRAVLGSIAYLSRLRTMDGGEIHFVRQGSMQSPVSGMPVDAYSLTSDDDKPLGTLYVSPYNKRNSGRTPRGFTLSAAVLPVILDL